MPSKPTPRIGAIRRWVALSTVVVFLSVWLVVLTLGKGGLATSNASPSTSTTSSASTVAPTTTTTDDAPAQTQDQAPSLDTSQS